jgi:hypothetical protein
MERDVTAISAVEEAVNDVQDEPTATKESSHTEDEEITEETAESTNTEEEDEQPEAAAVPQGNMAALQKLARRPKEPEFILEDNVKPRKTGFFFFAKTHSTADLMRWSKGRIPNYSLLELDDDYVLKSLAAKCFEDLQRVMGDRKGSKKVPAEQIQQLLHSGLFNVHLRDELYLQLVKQLTQNPSCESRLRGWEVVCCYSTCFPPTVKMERWLVDYVERVANETATVEGGEKVKRMAEYAVKKLKRLCQIGPKGHLPTVPEVERAIIAPFHPSPFGETLDEIMRHPELVDESGRYPRILIFLSEAVLKLGGCKTEGIFRVPGDIEGVNALKLRVENGQYSLGVEETGINDPSVPASLLKLWLRELAEPLIPASLYPLAIACPPDQPAPALTVLDRLPETNLLVAKYLVKYLQLIGDPRHQPVTKMNVSNLAMVFAPSFLRCPGDDPLTILANSRLEQMYIKTLINYLEN